MPRCVLVLAATAILAFGSVCWAAEPIPGVTAKATSAQVEGLFAAQNVCSDKGLTPAAGGELHLTTNGYAEGGNCWQSGYRDYGPDERPIIEFDLGKRYEVGRFRVWNHNGAPQRGFKEVSIDYSADGKAWTSLKERFLFQQAPKKDDYAGEEYKLPVPITARFIRFYCESTHRAGGQPDLAGLGKVRFYPSEQQPAAEAPVDLVPVPESPVFPDGSRIIDLKLAPYYAKGDGQADDSDAIQRAIDDYQGRRTTLLLPAGTYLVTKPLRFRPGAGNGYNVLRGAGRKETVLKLRDGTFRGADAGQPVLSLGFNGREDGQGVHADWFNNNVSDFTIDTGDNNPGAIALQFYSNNVGALRDVDLRSADGKGLIGLDLAYADQNGPCLIKNVRVSGFATGIRTGGTVNSQTLESVQITGATKIGIENAGQCLSIRDLQIKGTSPAILNRFGVVCLVDAHLQCTADDSGFAAITNHETLFARNIRTAGYNSAIDNRRERDRPSPSVETAKVDEWTSSPPISLFPRKSSRSLNLPVEEVPEIAWDRSESWANVRHFREITDVDDTAALQRAIDSGASTVFFPAGGMYYLSSTVEVRGNVRRLIGMFSGLRYIGKEGPALRVADGALPAVVVQDFTGDFQIEHAGQTSLLVKNGQDVNGIMTGGGKLFLENVVGDWNFDAGRVWARQFNNERLGTHIANRGAQLWILGLKTERGGTLIETGAGAATELLGGLSYTTNNGKLAPMFVSDNARGSYMLGEVCYTGDPFAVLVQETRDGVSETLKRGSAPLRPAFLQGSELPLYVGGPEEAEK